MLRLKRFLNDTCGATAIEYALLAALIAVAIAGVAATLGTSLTEAYQKVVNMFS